MLRSGAFPPAIFRLVCGRTGARARPAPDQPCVPGDACAPAAPPSHSDSCRALIWAFWKRREPAATRAETGVNPTFAAHRSTSPVAVPQASPCPQRGPGAAQSERKSSHSPAPTPGGAATETTDRRTRPPIALSDPARSPPGSRARPEPPRGACGLLGGCEREHACREPNCMKREGLQAAAERLVDSRRKPRASGTLLREPVPTRDRHNSPPR
jgi:hypothetical protein